MEELSIPIILPPCSRHLNDLRYCIKKGFLAINRNRRENLVGGSILVNNRDTVHDTIEKYSSFINPAVAKLFRFMGLATIEWKASD